MSDVPPETHTLERPDGVVLSGRCWRAPQATRVAVLVHGLGEHAGRHAELARFLVDRGYTVHAWDHRGHGRSQGPRGGLRRANDLVDDLGAVVDTCSAAPVLLFGHSLGGLVAVEFALRHPLRVEALVLSSPVLAPGLSAGEKLLLAMMSRVAPDVAVSNGIDASQLSHDESVVRAYLDDPLVHDRVTARLVRFIVDASRGAIDRAGALAVPTLLLFAGDDRVVDPQGSRDFAQRAPQSLLTAREYPGLRHEILNETPAQRATVYRDLGAWLRSEPVDE